MTREITTQEEKQRYRAHLEFLCRKSLDFLTSKDDQEIIGHLSYGISETVPASFILVFRFDNDSGEMKIRDIRDEQGINILQTVLAGEDFTGGIPSPVFSNDEQFMPMIRDDILQAIALVDGWRIHTVDIVANIGKTISERQLDSIMNLVHKHPNGIARSQIMQNYHLNARETELLFQTLDQRGLVRRVRRGKSELLFSAR